MQASNFIWCSTKARAVCSTLEEQLIVCSSSKAIFPVERWNAIHKTNIPFFFMADLEYFSWAILTVHAYSPSLSSVSKSKGSLWKTAFWSNSFGSKFCEVIYCHFLSSVFDYEMLPQIPTEGVRGEHVHHITFIKYENSEPIDTYDHTVSEEGLWIVNWFSFICYFSTLMLE